MGGEVSVHKGHLRLEPPDNAGPPPSPSWSRVGVCAAAGPPCLVLLGGGRSCLVSASRLSGVGAPLRPREAEGWAPPPRWWSQLWGGGRAWVLETGLGCLQGAAVEIPNFQRAWGGHRPGWRVTVGDIGAWPHSHPWGGVCCGSCLEVVWAPTSAATPPTAGVTPPIWLEVAGVQGQSAQGQQRGLSLLARKRLALVKLGIGCCLAAIVPTLIFTSCI